MAVEAYQIGIGLVADAKKVTGPIGEMLRSMDKLLAAVKETNRAFVEMASAVGGARRLASGMATDMERAARAARDIASASARFKSAPAASPANSDGSQNRRSGSNNAASVAASATIVARSSSYVSPYSAAATNVPGAPQQQIAQARRLAIGFDPGSINRTVLRGSSVPEYGSRGPGIALGPAYGPTPPNRTNARGQLLLGYDGPPPNTPGTALAAIPGQGNSYSSGANFRRSSYTPNFTMGDARPGVGYRILSDAPFGPMPYNGPRVSTPPAAGSGVRAAAGAFGAAFAKPGLGYLAPAGAALGVYGGYHFAQSAINQAGAIDQIYLGMMGDPVARASMRAIKASADQSLRDNPFLSPVDAARIAQEAYEVSGGKMSEQAGVARLINRTDRTFQLMGKSPADAMRESIAFIRAQDISNRFYDRKTGQFSMSRASASTDTALGMILANRQFMKGQNFQSFATSAGLAAQNMTDEGMLNLAHFIDVNPRKAGMQVRSFENLFSGDHTRMEPKDFNYFKSIGMIGKDGKFKGQDIIQTNPIGWMMQYMNPALDKHPELLGHIQRMNVSDLAGEARGATGNIARQYAMGKRTDAAAAVAALATGPKAAQLAMATSFERLETVVGKIAEGPFVKGMNSLTTSFNAISDYLAKHPDDIKQFADDLTALVRVVGGIAGAVGKVMSVIPGPIRRIVESTIAGAAGGAVLGSVVPGVGTAAVAAGGAAAGFVAGVAHEGVVQSDRITHVGTVNLQVSLNKQVIAQAVQDVQFSQARQRARSTTAAPDWGQHLQMPNAQGGVN